MTWLNLMPGPSRTGSIHTSPVNVPLALALGFASLRELWTIVDGMLSNCKLGVRVDVQYGERRIAVQLGTIVSFQQE